jgi:N-acetylmuramoyl-L-alanine amidase
MSGFRMWSCRRTIIAAMAILLLLPAGVGHAGLLTDLFKGSSKAGNPSKSAAVRKHVARARHAVSSEHAATPKPHVAEEPQPAKPVAETFDPAKLRIVVDVGHTAKSEGALSARNVPEFDFNLHLAEKIVDKLKSEGFAQAKLLVTEGNARPSLIERVAAANKLHADLFLSIHHDSVPDKMMETWEYEGKKSHYSDRFSGYGLFVSKENPDFETSMRFAKLIGTQMRAEHIKFADQYTLPIMGKYRHDLLDKDAGIYRYDHLVVLQRTHMPAVLLEAGSIINRDEELQMASPERQDMTVKAVTTAVQEFCGVPVKPSGPALAADTQAKADH